MCWLVQYFFLGFRHDYPLPLPPSLAGSGGGGPREIHYINWIEDELAVVGSRRRQSGELYVVTGSFKPHSGGRLAPGRLVNHMTGSGDRRGPGLLWESFGSVCFPFEVPGNHIYSVIPLVCPWEVGGF